MNIRTSVEAAAWGPKPIPVPPEHLICRACGPTDNPTESFLTIGRKCSDDVRAALWKVGRMWGSFQQVLDFGCGCGRTLRWLAYRCPTMKLSGCDVDAKSIDWCQQHFPELEFTVNDTLPPISFPDDRFDLVLLISVLTHMNEESQTKWLGEVVRITKPGGIVLLTIHGPQLAAPLPAPLTAQLQTTGFLFCSGDGTVLPADQWGSSYQTVEYVAGKLSRSFEVLAHLPRGLNQHHDIVVLQKAA
jgi:SAM-dependent methyltransferase